MSKLGIHISNKLLFSVYFTVMDFCFQRSPAGPPAPCRPSAPRPSPLRGPAPGCSTAPAENGRGGGGLSPSSSPPKFKTVWDYK